MLDMTRRAVLKAGLAFTACAAAPSLAHAFAKQPVRSINMFNAYTGEALKTVYWEQGQYLSEPMKDIAYMLRDHRNDEMAPIDPRLIDIMHRMQAALDTRTPFEIVCGYRCPESNAYIYKRERGVARNSYHMYGRAIDIRMRGRGASQLRRAAISLQAGGVGYYPQAGFVHLDTGGVRHW